MTTSELFWNELINQDCIKGMMQRLPDNSVQLCVVDPPFNIGYAYDAHYSDKRESADYLAWCQEWLTQLHRVLTAYGTCWIAIGPKYVSELDCLAKRLGFFKRGHIIWYYSFGVNSVKKFTPASTHLLYLTKHPDQFIFRPEEIKVKSARELVYNDKRAKKGGRLPDDVWILRPQDVPAGFDPQSDCWHVPRVAGTFKARIKGIPNQIPEQLLGRIIRSCSYEQDIVLDCFAGSASTLAVAKKLNRRFLGFEISPEYTKIGRERLASINIGDDLTGPVPQGG